ncbi:MAG: DUF5615 family PIN-like protein [Candidatus Cloacimonadales bacterium]|nr:DUF5615 family PIN-like protein [Candidatus Cloacimonadales bacterium]
MLLNILADECVDFRIVKKLRSLDFEVISILEDFQGVDDKTVLDIARKNKALLMSLLIESDFSSDRPDLQNKEIFRDESQKPGDSRILVSRKNLFAAFLYLSFLFIHQPVH